MKFSLVLLCLLNASLVSSITINWIGGVSGNFSNILNWVGGVLPGVNDVAITSAGTYVVSVYQNAQITGSLTLGGGVPTLFVATGATFTVYGDISLQSGNIIVQDGANLIVNGSIVKSTNSDSTITVNGLTNNGQIQPKRLDVSAGTLSLQGTGKLILAGINATIGAGAELISNVTTEVDSATSFSFAAGAQVVFNANLYLRNSVTLVGNFYFESGSTIAGQTQATILTLNDRVTFITSQGSKVNSEIAIVLNANATVNGVVQTSNTFTVKSTLRLNDGFVVVGSGANFILATGSSVYATGSSGVNATSAVVFNAVSQIQVPDMSDEFYINAGASFESGSQTAFYGHVIVKNDITVKNGAQFAVDGTSSIINCTNVVFESTATYALEAENKTSGRIVAAGSAAFNGIIAIGTCYSLDANITAVTYTSHTGTFSSLTVSVVDCTSLTPPSQPKLYARRQEDSNSDYEMKYDNNRAYAYKDVDDDNDDSSSKVIMYSSAVLVGSFALLSLFI